MTEAPGGSAGFGHGSDPDEHEALLRRIREFLRHGAAAEAGVEEWGEFAAQLRFLREELPPEERSALLERWDRVLLRALPDLQLPSDQRENVLLALEAAAAEGAAWAPLAADVRGLLAEGQPTPAFPEADQPSGLPSLRVDAEAGFACTGFSIRGLPAIGIQSSRNDPPLAFLVLDSEQLGELLERARELLGTSA